MPKASAVPNLSAAPVDASAGPSGEAARRYGALFNRSSDAVYVHDFQGRFIDANEAALRLIGYAREHIDGLSFAHLLDDAQLPAAIAALQEIMSTGRQSRPTVYRLRRKDGSFVDVETRATAIELEGHPTAVLGIARDITERRRAEEALQRAHDELELRVDERTTELRRAVDALSQEAAERREAEEALRLQSEILQNVAEAVYLIRASDGVIVYTNPSFERLFGYGPGEMVGKRVSVVNAPTDKSPEETAKEIIAALDRTGVWRGEILNIKKDGTPFWCHANVTTFDHPGHGRVWVTYHTDITERKRADEALRQSEVRYRSLYSKTPAMLHSIDTDGRLLAVSDQWLEVFGYERDEVIGRKSVGFLTEESKRYAETVTLPEFWKTGYARDVSFQFVRKNGEIVDVLLSAVVERDPQGNVLRTLAVLNDITERKRVEEALQQAREQLEGKVERALAQKNPYGLTFRELTVLHLVAAGKADKQVAKELGISPLTVHKHVANIRAKMDVSSRTEAVGRALREGLLE